MTTRVIFRIENDPAGIGLSDVIAVFPGMIERDYSIACYSRIGQHSSMDAIYYRRHTKPAKLSDAVRVQALRNELESMGYDLKIVTRR